MSALAKAPVIVLEETWDTLAPKPAYNAVQGPETGLVMIRARTGQGRR